MLSTGMAPASPTAAEVERFRADVEALTGRAPDVLGVAVSGGPDSLALLLLARAAYPGGVVAATLDHKLRPESAAEAAFVATVCERLGVPHASLAILDNLRIVGGSKQAKAREARYLMLAGWLAGLGGSWLATAHHLDDQAETLLMRLNRGAGATGLSGIRPRRRLNPLLSPQPIHAVRPLLKWRKAELIGIVAAAGLDPVDDPSNRAQEYDRARMRALLARTPELDAVRLAASASHLADAREALEWVVEREWKARSRVEKYEIIHLRIDHLPRELLRRLVMTAIDENRAGFGAVEEWRRDKLPAGLERLANGKRITLAGIKITPSGSSLRFEPAPPRRR